jgi:hypothetical protein
MRAFYRPRDLRQQRLTRQMGELTAGGRATFVTIATPDRAAQSRVLARSARKCHPGARLAVLVLGPDAAAPMFEDLYDFAISVEQLSLGCFADMRFRYSTPELCFALKPWVIGHLLQKFPDEPVYYFDSDIELFAPLAEAEAVLARGANLVMTPHILQPAPDQESEEDLLRSGSFNGGFLGVAPSAGGRAFVAWWGGRLRTGCTIDFTCGDQRWLDLVPSIWDGVAILRHPGYNFACWNAHQRPLIRLDGAWTAAGQPLRFVHYTKWNLREQDSEHYLAENFRPGYRAFSTIFDDYQRKVRAEDRFDAEGSQLIQDEVLAPAERPVADLVRSAYAKHAPTVDGDAEEVAARAVAILNAPTKSRAELPDLPMTLLYDEIWQRHADLRYRFDADHASGRQAYLRWLVEGGLAGLGIPAAFAAPARSALGLPELEARTDAVPALVEWLQLMSVGPAGERTPAGVSTIPGEAGHLVYGPYVRLGAGHYRVRVHWSAGQPLRAVLRSHLVATIEVVTGDGKTYLAQRELRVGNYAQPVHELSLDLSERALATSPIEVRVWTGGMVPLTVSSITVERIAAPQTTTATS